MLFDVVKMRIACVTQEKCRVTRQMSITAAFVDELDTENVRQMEE